MRRVLQHLQRLKSSPFVETLNKQSTNVVSGTRLEILAENSLSNKDIVAQIQNLLEQVAAENATPRASSLFSLLKEKNGWCVVKKPSSFPNAGYGAFLDGKAGVHEVLSIYPGAVYNPGDPIFFPSFRNPYVIRRSDGVSIDGKYFSLSKYIYSSLAAKQGPGLCDASWLQISSDSWEHKMRSPLSQGQLINHYLPLLDNMDTTINNRAHFAPNVMYCEFEFPMSFPEHLRYLIPHCNYEGALVPEDNRGHLIKSIAMISLREICDEELFSDYKWISIPKS